MSDNLEELIAEYIGLGMRKILRLFIKPDKEYRTVKDITTEDIIELKDKFGIAGIILDMDGTIKTVKNGVPKDVENWIEEVRKEIRICIVSNAMEKQVEEVATKLKLEYISFACKPKRKPFIEALDKLGLDNENVIVIGDSILADVIGARRVGIRSVLVNNLNKEEER